MTHTFEFVVTKKQTPQEIEEKKEQEVLNLMYKTKSKRLAKVAESIRAELEEKNVIKRDQIQDLYLRLVK